MSCSQPQDNDLGRSVQLMDAVLLCPSAIGVDATTVLKPFLWMAFALLKHTECVDGSNLLPTLDSRPAPSLAPASKSTQLLGKYIYSKKKVTYQAVFFRDAPQLVWSFSPAQPCARYSRAFNSSTRIVYLAVFKQILFHYISRFGFYLQGKIKVISYFFL